MNFASLTTVLTNKETWLAKGPIALIFAEDATELLSTIMHHANLGFRQVFVFLKDSLDTELEEKFAQDTKIHTIRFSDALRVPHVTLINQILQVTPPKTWFYYCFNAEYLFFPFSESRNIEEMLIFHNEERRPSMLTYVVDLYAIDLAKHPSAVDIDTAHFDIAGYFALARPNPENHNYPRDEQLSFYGGLKWRFEEFVPKEKRRIDRMGLFRSAEGLALRDDHLFNLQNHNTYACPWHNNLTAAIASFRTAKALRRNPGSRYDVKSFVWHNSRRFEWRSQQLLDLGIIEPGQWF